MPDADGLRLKLKIIVSIIRRYRWMLK